MCLRYSPTIVACVCIHLACKWSNYKIPLSAQKKEWFSYIDPEATFELLERLTEEFLAIFEKCPSRLKKKILQSSQAVSSSLELLLIFSDFIYIQFRNLRQSFWNIQLVGKLISFSNFLWENPMSSNFAHLTLL